MFYTLISLQVHLKTHKKKKHEHIDEQLNTNIYSLTICSQVDVILDIYSLILFLILVFLGNFYSK